MEESVQLFEIWSRGVVKGMAVRNLVQTGDKTNPVIFIGASRLHSGVLQIKLTLKQHVEWLETGNVVIQRANLRTFKDGNMSLYSREVEPEFDNSEIIVIFRADNDSSCIHLTGDLIEFPKEFMLREESLKTVTKRLQSTFGTKRLEFNPMEFLSPKEVELLKKGYAFDNTDFVPASAFLEFPGTVLMCIGEDECIKEAIAEIPINNIFRVYFHNPSGSNKDIDMYYVWDGKELLSGTWDDREATKRF
ncbi:TPA: hypothetical protein DHW62_00275 [candidate division WWE3 bacterium]|uniref:Uncharacterized protein n=1 Tax=candidate division WWE3 bacterium TaxID=2053526 RepID=A0A656PL90_UNCKA|nr:hypothetical protein P147_WWE3C00001G0213 [candidate division WWE3 bacterium RAAC2_WWE3_1]KKS29888.1 MAG: hypothetical protein UU91_C0003G0046 [candidate division WWE3 bacterium GW2011_GWB1_42_117]KKS55313.1 MAG: hypothetical protein UV21_C0002G0187 [candidate division WWE3 bacterium GW2011_GWD2_42_34]KKT05866.1 MAG: hypothetical protein UV83_C0001G0184 [candidate division WWE3 bacterium GW2011_GWE2_43_18]KKT07244.1 MAG: hypothetical protein UV84_C0001G0080 [candidate division WWE3 bacterium